MKILGILDEYTRECLCLKVARHFTCVDVISEISALIETRGVPEHIRSDNGPEFIAVALKDWIESRRIGTLYINPGSPWENAQHFCKMRTSIVSSAGSGMNAWSENSLEAFRRRGML